MKRPNCSNSAIQVFLAFPFAGIFIAPGAFRVQMSILAIDQALYKKEILLGREAATNAIKELKSPTRYFQIHPVHLRFFHRVDRQAP